MVKKAEKPSKSTIKFNEEKNVRVSIEVPSHIRKALKSKAAAEGKTIKEVIYALIENYINR